MAMSWQERIVVDPEILVGKPVVKGTRLAVEFVVELLAQGWSEETIVENYPGLAREDIRACLAYASAALRDEKVYPLAV
jgi:uncharacterized protein (DUF433 family)